MEIVKMTKKSMKIALLLIAAVMLVSIAFAGAASADATNTSITNWAQLKQNISTWNSVGGTEMLTIILPQNFDSSDANGNVNIKIKKNVTIMPVSGTGEVVLDAKQNGCLFNVYGGNLTLAGNGNCVLNLTGGSGFSSMYGGGVCVSSGSFTMNAGVNITNCFLESNGYGGGVCVYASFTLNGGNITNCSASQCGGGVYVQPSGAFTMTGGTIANCTAAGGGGVGINSDGKFVMDGGTITNCSASIYGSGVYVEGPPGVFHVDGTATIGANDVALNTINPNFAKIITSSSFKGRVENITLWTSTSQVPATWVNQIIVENGAGLKEKFKLSRDSAYSNYKLEDSGNDLILAAGAPPAPKSPYVEVSTWAELNQSVSEWNATGAEEGLTRIVAVNQSIGTRGPNENKDGINVTGNVIVTTVASPAAEYKIDGKEQGRLFNVTGGNLTIKGNGTATLNLTGGLAPTEIVPSEFGLPNNISQGGGIMVNGGSLTLETGAKIINCSAVSSSEDMNYDSISLGGGIYFTGGGNLTLNGGDIINCSAVSFGDGYSQAYGGGIDFKGGNLTLNGGGIINCHATAILATFGGGIDFTDGNLILNGGDIINCHAITLDEERGTYADGGGIHINGVDTVIMNSGNITDCTAWNSGGICFQTSKKFIMTGGNITNCSVTGAGGGVFFDCYNPAEFIMTGGNITNCMAVWEGGGYYNNNDNTKMFMSGGTIKGNKASQGAGIYNKGMLVVNGTASISADNDVALFDYESRYCNITVDGDSFTGSVGNITLYSQLNYRFVENPTAWLGQVIVRNGASVSSWKDKFNLSSSYSENYLKAVNGDLVLGPESYPITITNKSDTYQLKELMTKVYSDTGSGYANLTKVDKATGTYTLELNGFNASNMTANKPIINASVANLTIVLKGDSNLTSSLTSESGLLYSSGNLTITTEDDGKLLVNNTAANTAYAIYAGNDVTINDGTVNATIICSTEGIAICSDSGSVIINDGTINATSTGFFGILARSGSITITSVDQLIANGDMSSFAYNKGSGSLDIDALASGYTFSNATHPGSKPTSYDNFKNNWYQFITYNCSDYSSVKIVNESEPSMDTVYVVPPGTTPLQPNQFTSLEDAYGNVTEGGTICLQTDVTLTKPLVLHKPVTIDGLNGKNRHKIITNVEAFEGYDYHPIKINGTAQDGEWLNFTIRDLTIDFNNQKGNMVIQAHNLKTDPCGNTVNLTNVTLTNAFTDYETIADLRSSLHIDGANVTVRNLTLDDIEDVVGYRTNMIDLHFTREYENVRPSNLTIDNLRYGAVDAGTNVPATVYQLMPNGGTILVEPGELMGYRIWEGFVTTKQIKNENELADAVADENAKFGDVLELTDNFTITQDLNVSPKCIFIDAFNETTGIHYQMNLTEGTNLTVNDYVFLYSLMRSDICVLHGEGWIVVSESFINPFAGLINFPPNTRIKIGDYVDGKNTVTFLLPEDSVAMVPVTDFVRIGDNKNVIIEGDGTVEFYSASEHPFKIDGNLTLMVPFTFPETGVDVKGHVWVAPFVQPENGNILNASGAEIDVNSELCDYNASYSVSGTTLTIGDNEYTLDPASGYTGEWVVDGTDGKITNARIAKAEFTKSSTPYTPTPSHKESGQTVIQQQAPVQDVSADPTPANQATADITVKYVGQSVLGTSTADTAALKEQYPEAAAQVELSFAMAQEAGIPLTNSKGAKAVVVTDQNIPGVEKVTFSRVYEISPANEGEKLTKVTVKVPKTDVTSKGLTSDDVTVYHYLENYKIWQPLETLSVSQDENNYYYTAATDGTSPFGVLVKKIGSETTTPTTTQTQKSPAPLAGILAGLGGAAVLMRMRR